MWFRHLLIYAIYCLWCQSGPRLFEVWLCEEVPLYDKSWVHREERCMMGMFYLKYVIKANIQCHNIIHIHTNVLWGWQYSTYNFQVFPTFRLNIGNFMWNIANPMEHSYGYEWCYGHVKEMFFFQLIRTRGIACGFYFKDVLSTWRIQRLFINVETLKRVELKYNVENLYSSLI